MEGDVETIRAFTTGEAGEEGNTAEGGEITLVLFTMPTKTLVLFAGLGKGVLLILAKCVEVEVSVLLILGGKLAGLSWRG